MAQTTLKMLIQMRRDEVFSTGFVLQAGEPGFEISTNTFKIGDGTKTWAELDFANKSLIDALIAVVDKKVDDLGNVATDEEVEEIRKTLAAATKQVADDLAAYELANDARVKLVEDSLAEGGATANAIKAAKDAADAAQKDVDDLAALVDFETMGSYDGVDTVPDYVQYIASATANDAANTVREELLEDIGDLEKYVGTFPDTTLADGTKVETVVGYINAKTSGIATDANLKLIEDRVTAIEEAPYATEEHVRESISDLYNGNILTLEEKLEGIDDSVTDYISRYDSTEINPIRTSLNELTKEDGVIDAIEADIANIKDTYATKDHVNGQVDTALQAAKDYSDAQDVFHTDMLTVDKFGGIAGGANLNGKTTHQILTDLLYPYIAFVINSSSRNAAAATLECGQSQTLSSATISVTKKKDPITSIKLFNGSTLLEEKTGEAVANGGSITFNGFDAITVTKDNNPNLKFTVTDGTTSTDKNVGASTFVYPYYWGVCAENAAIDEALIEGLTKSVSSKGTKTDISFTCAQQKIVFAYPKAHGVLKSIIDPNNFETIDGYARSEVSITGLDGSTQAYYVYVQKDACTVSDFKVDFKY